MKGWSGCESSCPQGGRRGVGEVLIADWSIQNPVLKNLYNSMQKYLPCVRVRYSAGTIMRMMMLITITIKCIAIKATHRRRKRSPSALWGSQKRYSHPPGPAVERVVQLTSARDMVMDSTEPPANKKQSTHKQNKCPVCLLSSCLQSPPA